METFLKLSLDTRRKNIHEFPLIFRLTHNQKTTSIAAGIRLKKSDWDSAKQQIKTSYAGNASTSRLNNSLRKKRAKMIDVLTKWEDRGKLKYMSLKEVRNLLTNKTKEITFFQFTEAHILELKKASRIGNSRVYQHALNAVRNYRNGKDFTFNELNLKFLKDFENYYLSKGNKLGGISVYLRTIRAINRKAILAGVAEKEGYAFENFKIRSGKPRKRTLPPEAIPKIINLELDEGTTLFRDRYIFLLSFFLNGMSYVDIANLKVANIIDGRIQYIRKKTSEPFSIKISPQLVPIVTYFTKGKSEKDYLIQIERDRDPIIHYDKVMWARDRYNKNLKKLGKMAGIEERITSYAARHTFASSADDMGVPLTAISQMLGHQRVSTTQAYLANLRKSRLDEYQRKIFEGY